MPSHKASSAPTSEITEGRRIGVAPASTNEEVYASLVKSRLVFLKADDLGADPSVPAIPITGLCLFNDFKHVAGKAQDVLNRREREPLFYRVHIIHIGSEGY